jgi:limonene-1,2-epoxide hydrolase
MSAADVVASFIRAIERKDLDTAMELLAEDVSYENVPMQPIPGRAATRKVMEGFLSKATEVEWRVLRQHEVGNVVWNERVDRFVVNGTWVELPVAGVFEVNEAGMITLWRDYFDLSTYQQQMAAALGT